MSNILKATVAVQGVRPLFFHRFGPDALPLEKQERTGVAGNSPDEWRKTVLVTKTGQLFLDPTYAFGCIREAARYTKKGKGSIQTMVSASLQVTDAQILIDRFFPGWPKKGKKFDVLTETAPCQDADEPVYLDVRGVRNPTTKARNVRYRIAASAGWGCSFHIEFDKTVVSRGEIEAVLHDAGRLVGLGNGRSIGMGRFQVLSFKITEDAA
jgi:hypothetical protein